MGASRRAVHTYANIGNIINLSQYRSLPIKIYHTNYISTTYLNIFDENLSKRDWTEYDNRLRSGQVNPNNTDNSNTRFDATAFFVIEQYYLQSQLQGTADAVKRYNKDIEWSEETYSNHTFGRVLNNIKYYHELLLQKC